ncbi:MAG TPA: TIGR04255 family protein [Fimbriimonadaceae bacterium]|nr:TIGR04255 family protein [Fimbriimonadaceae bacterium]HRJ96496.1 TIGR04255 family protein [Fimbriimonadaceae bacterium]
MSDGPLQLDHAPIIEVVVDIECDLAPDFSLQAVEPSAVDAFRARYPKKSYQFVEQVSWAVTPEGSSQEHRRTLQALRFHDEADRQLVQVRATGFSFNRLAPYTSLDDYLPMIRLEWDIFCQVAKPVQVTGARLRYINRIELPSGPIEIAEYFTVGKSLPYADLTLTRIVNQFAAIEETTGATAKVTLADSHESPSNAVFILDIEAERQRSIEPDDWDSIEATLLELRGLKNRLFRGALTDSCIKLFQDP